MKKTNNKKGFTIVELVIVIAVIAILAAVMIPTFAGVIDNAHDNSALQEARNVYTQYISDNAENGTLEENFIYVYEAEDASKENGRYVVIKDGALDEKVYENKDGAIAAFATGSTVEGTSTTGNANLYKVNLPTTTG